MKLGEFIFVNGLRGGGSSTTKHGGTSIRLSNLDKVIHIIKITAGGLGRFYDGFGDEYGRSGNCKRSTDHKYGRGGLSNDESVINKRGGGDGRDQLAYGDCSREGGENSESRAFYRSDKKSIKKRFCSRHG